MCRDWCADLILKTVDEISLGLTLLLTVAAFLTMLEKFRAFCLANLTEFFSKTGSGSGSGSFFFFGDDLANGSPTLLLFSGVVDVGGFSLVVFFLFIPKASSKLSPAISPIFLKSKPNCLANTVLSPLETCLPKSLAMPSENPVIKSLAGLAKILRTSPVA